MEADDRLPPEIFIEGIDEVLKRDLAKHKDLLAKTKGEIDAYRAAVKHESAKKRHYYRQIGKGKYDDKALKRSVKDIRLNMRHLSDRVKQAEEKIEHHQLIIDTLTAQLEEYNRRYADLH